MRRTESVPYTPCSPSSNSVRRTSGNPGCAGATSVRPARRDASANSAAVSAAGGFIATIHGSVPSLVTRVHVSSVAGGTVYGVVSGRARHHITAAPSSRTVTPTATAEVMGLVTRFILAVTRVAPSYFTLLRSERAVRN